ncbi:MAG: hypothetical protein NC293_03200 [Roseburia sp.]|nr:hypothetical protein [Roseburia sp.]
MKNRTNVKISYVFDKKRKSGTGICVSEGRTGICLPGGFPGLPAFFRRSNSCMAVMCRMRTENSGMENMIHMLNRFEKWFQNELPSKISPLEADVVRCYWQEFAAEVILADGRSPDVAAFLIHDGHYLFFNTGEIQIYEGDDSGKRFKRWPTCQERKRLDVELGISEAEAQSTYFKCRKISKRGIFLIVPDQIQTINPKTFITKKEYKKWIKTFLQSAQAAVVIRYREG